MLQRDVAQLGSAHVWGAWSRKFKSCHPDQKGGFLATFIFLPTFPLKMLKKQKTKRISLFFPSFAMGNFSVTLRK